MVWSPSSNQEMEEAMKLEVGSWTIEITRTHAYFKMLGWEGLWDFTGQVGSSLNKT